jgi:ferredoxin
VAGHSVRLKTLEAETLCGSDQPVLDAFLRENVWLPHGCAQGTCGSCKLRVIEGEVDHGAAPEFTLTAAERAEGLALACQARPRSDLLVEPLADIADDGVVRHPLCDVVGTVAELTDIVRGTRRLVIDLDERSRSRRGSTSSSRSPAPSSAGSTRWRTRRRRRRAWNCTSGTPRAAPRPTAGSSPG